MNKIFKYVSLSVACLLGVALASCSDNDYEYSAPTAETGEQVYFPNTLSENVEISTSANTFTVPVRRNNTSDAATVNLTFKPDSANICTVPSSVSFAAGDSVAYLTVSYDPTKVVYGTYAGGTISIADAASTTVYGQSSYTFKAGVTSWVNMSGKATYREDLVGTFFNVDNVTYEVGIQKSVITDGLYRLVNPYGAAYPYNKAGDYDTSKDYYMEINASDPNFVYVGDYYSEMHWGDYGQFHFVSYVQYQLSRGKTLAQVKQAYPEYFGTLSDGVITMPAESMLIGLANHENGDLYISNNNGLFAVALPGYAIADYSVSVEYAGRFTDPAMNDFADLNVTLSSDIATAKVALVPKSNWAANADAVVSGINSDAIASTTITASGLVRSSYDGTDSYVVVVVYYDAAGNMKGYYASDAIKLTSSKDAIEQFSDVYGGALTLGAKDLSADFSSTGKWGVLLGQAVTQEAIMSQSKSDPTHFKLAPLFQEDYPLDFHYDATTGVITVDQCPVYTSKELSLIATDIVTWYQAIANRDLSQLGYGSYFDSATNTFHFQLMIAKPGYTGYYFIEEETFEITATAAKAIKAAQVAAQASNRKVTATQHKLNSRLMRVKGDALER